MANKSVDFGKIINRSWEVTLKNKWLWVIGIVLAVFGGGAGGTNLYSNFSNAQKGTNSATSSSQFTDVIGNLLKSVPVATWVLLVLGFILIILFSVAVAWIIVSWAKGALIKGFDDAEKDKKVDLKILGSHGIASLKKLFIYNLISIGMFLAIMVGSLIVLFVLGVIFAFIPVVGVILMIPLWIIGFLGIFILVVLFAMISIYAERLIVLKNYSPWVAWKKGLSLSRGNFLHSLIMGIINTAIGCSVGCLSMLVLLIILGLPALLFAIPMFSGGSFHLPNIFQIIGIVVLVIFYFVANSVIRAFLIVFNYGNWNQLFWKVMKEELK
ncbi:MAG TPA: hypothetical protein VF185_01280 [Patescibacteria group bacterium]